MMDDIQAMLKWCRENRIAVSELQMGDVRICCMDLELLTPPAVEAPHDDTRAPENYTEHFAKTYGIAPPDVGGDE